MLANGFCNVCTEAIMDVNAEHDAKKKENESLIKDLIVLSEKLGRGETVDQNMANRLIMGGIIALISKNNVFDENLDARIVKLEVEQITTKNRLESIETWTLKQDEKLKELKENAAKEYEVKKDTPKDTNQKDNRGIKCNLCKRTFARNCDLEIHMDEHEKEKKYRCNSCEKTFHLQWRRNKHEKSHKETDVKLCRYFGNQEPCPYEEIGCMFRHDQSIFCRTKDCTNLLCPFSHQIATNAEEDIVEDIAEDIAEETVEDIVEAVSDEDQEEPVNVVENQCHICRIQLSTKDQFYYHIEVNHVEYFRGMMEIIGNRSSLNTTLGVS